MFKKNVFIPLLILISFVLTSCSITKNDVLPTVTQRPIGVQQTEKPTSAVNDINSNSSKIESSSILTYELTKERYTEADKNIKIEYPQIINLSDNNKQKTINTIIKNEALQILKDYKSGNVELTVLEIGNDIKLKSDNILSIQYSGYANFKNAAHPYHIFFTTNININKSSSIKLMELVNINKDFLELFRTGKFKSVSPIYQAGYLENSPNDELIEAFKTAQFYLTKDFLGFSLSVPYAMGDHVEFEIKHQDLKDNLKTGNEIWKDLLH